MYRYADKVLMFLARQYLQIFAELKRRRKDDDADFLLMDVQSVYAKALLMLKRVLLEVARRAYRKAGGRSDDDIDWPWLDDFLQRYDPVMKFVFANEVERREARTFEAIVATRDPITEADRAVKDWMRLSAQYAEEATDAGNIEGLRASGIKEVQWVSMHDARRCAECRALDEKVFPIDKIPNKPHPRCRCYVIAYKKGGQSDE